MAKAKITFEGFTVDQIGLDRDVSFPAYLISVKKDYGIFRYNEDQDELFFIPNPDADAFPWRYEYHEGETLEHMLSNLDLQPHEVEVEIELEWRK